MTIAETGEFPGTDDYRPVGLPPARSVEKMGRCSPERVGYHRSLPAQANHRVGCRRIGSDTAAGQHLVPEKVAGPGDIRIRGILLL
jgi:hypothetical protein